MTELFHTIRTRSHRHTSDAGASMVEYALLVVLIAILGFVAVQLAGGTLSDTYHDISDQLTNARAN